MRHTVQHLKPKSKIDQENVSIRFGPADKDNTKEAGPTSQKRAGVVGEKTYPRGESTAHQKKSIQRTIIKTKTKTKTQSGEPARGARSAPSVGCFNHRVFPFVCVLIFV